MIIIVNRYRNSFFYILSFNEVCDRCLGFGLSHVCPHLLLTLSLVYLRDYH